MCQIMELLMARCSNKKYLWYLELAQICKVALLQEMC